MNKYFSFNKIFFYLINTILMFLYLYQFSMTIFGLPAQWHSTRIGAIGIIIYGILMSIGNNNKLSNCPIAHKSLSGYLKLIGFLFVYSFIQFEMIGKIEGIHLLEMIMNIVLFTIPVIWALNKIFDDLDSFLEVLILVGIVQSVFIVVCLANESFALALDMAVNNMESETHNANQLRYGYAGGVGCITAPGMIRFSTGLFAAAYLYVKRGSLTILCIFILFAILNSMISRTGLLFDLLCIGYVIICTLKKRNIIKFTFPLSLICIVLLFVVSTGKYDTFLSERYQRFRNLKENGVNEDFFSGYFGGDVPPLTMETLFGVGVTSGVSGNGYVVRTDGGPLRIYSAVGLITAIFIYVYIFKMMKHNFQIASNLSDKRFLWLIFILYILADYKEITYFIVWPMTIYFQLIFLMERKSINSYK